MTTVKDLSSGELILFRKKMILVYDNNNGLIKAEASVVLSMIEEELLVRGIEISEEEVLSPAKIFSTLLNRLKALFVKPPLILSKSSEF